MSNLSFVQTQKHLTKTDRFKVITPDEIRQVMDTFGFDLISLKTGRAKNPDRIDFQTTIARYRSRDQFEVLGCNFDIVFKVPHLYGALKGMLGMFRQVCSNGLIVGRDFDVVRVPHLERPVEELNVLIPMLVAQRTKLVEQVKAMQSTQVTKAQLAQLAETVGQIRLNGVENITRIESQDLLKPRRSEDLGSDLFTVLNVLQENALRHGIRYQTAKADENGVLNYRNMNTRKVSEKSVKSIDLNASIWDAAAKLLIPAA
jgi:Domain of unknown function (DUF932)